MGRTICWFLYTLALKYVQLLLLLLFCLVIPFIVFTLHVVKVMYNIETFILH